MAQFQQESFQDFWEIDWERIGIMGGSAGGHRSLMQGTAGNVGQVIDRWVYGYVVDEEVGRMQ